MVKAQEWLDKWYPEEGCLKDDFLDGGGTNFNKKRSEITWLDIRKQNLAGSLDLSDFSSLKSLQCSDNQLTDLDLTNNQQLDWLSIENNNFSQDLSKCLLGISDLVNLEALDLKNNHFTGSLKPLRNCNKLRDLNISNTDITHGLEYLPESIKYFDCSFKGEYRVSDIWEELQPFESKYFGKKLKSWRKVKWDKELSLTISPLLPPQLIDKIKKGNKFRENYGIPNIDYEEIHFNQWRRIRKNKSLSSEELPIKLYNIKEKKVEKTKGSLLTKLFTPLDIKNYAILSYVWGNPKVKTNEGIQKQSWYKEELNISGNKALYKAVQTCQHLDISHLWIDQLCIKQDDPAEKSKEIGKMRQYYTNATFTLISINTELGDISNVNMMDILKAIVRSEWFTRSWTFQEGWLSKQTLFMFDDKLIDGRAMAGTWALNQLKYSGEGGYSSRREFEKGTKKIATPVGWTYYRDGYTENDKVEMTLSQALKEIKNRGRGVPVDGIYSILGLLPYGGKVEVRYKGNLCKKCKEKENNWFNEHKKTIICEHSEKTEWPTYFQEELNQVLYEVMEVAVGYGEPLAWYGVSNSASGLCWMPNIDEGGSTSIVGSIDIRYNNSHGNIFKEEGLRLFSSTYIIHKISSATQKLEEGFEIEGGLYSKKIEVKPQIRQKYSSETENEYKKYLEKAEDPILISLCVTKDTLVEVKEGNLITVPSKGQWMSKKPFGLLVKYTGRKSKEKYYETGIYHRLGLVEIGDSEKLQGGIDVWITIGSNQELQAQIEQPPK